jgi:hypothetical protein
LVVERKNVNFKFLVSVGVVTWAKMRIIVIYPPPVNSPKEAPKGTESAP